MKVECITYEYLKKQYHKMALKTHPDRCGGNTQTFQYVHEAYTYILNDLDLENNDNFVSSSTPTNETYIILLTTMLRSYLNVDIPDILVSVIKEITINYSNISNTIFENIDKISVINMYNLLYKYQDQLGISDDVLENVKKIITCKYEHDTIVVIEPSLEDIWNDNIYKLYVNEKLYLVPLWHHEVYFDSETGIGDVIALIHPILPDELTISENNNIHISSTIMGSEIQGMISNNTPIRVTICNTIFSIPVSNLYMKPSQIYILNGKGILKINDDCNADVRSNVIITINIV